MLSMKFPVVDGLKACWKLGVCGLNSIWLNPHYAKQGIGQRDEEKKQQPPRQSWAAWSHLVAQSSHRQN